MPSDTYNPPLLALPPELRSQIYTHLLLTNAAEPQTLSHPLPTLAITSVSPPPPPSSALLVHSLLTSELVSHYHALATYKLVLSHAFNFFRVDPKLANLEKSYILKRIRNIELVFFQDILLLKEYPSFGLESFCREIARRAARAVEVLLQAMDLKYVTVSWIDTTEIEGRWDIKAQILEPLRRLKDKVGFVVGEVRCSGDDEKEKFMKAARSVLGESVNERKKGQVDHVDDGRGEAGKLRMLAFDVRQGRGMHVGRGDWVDAYWTLYRKYRPPPDLTVQSASSRATASSVESLIDQVPPPGSPNSRSPSPGAPVSKSSNQSAKKDFWATLASFFRAFTTSLAYPFIQFKACLAWYNADGSCESRAVAILQLRRERQEQKYTVRPADAYLWADPERTVPTRRRKDIVDAPALRRAREEADELTQIFSRYKREADCLGNGEANGNRSLWNCFRCGRLTCTVRALRATPSRHDSTQLTRFFQACRHHTTYRIISTRPLAFADDPTNAGGLCDATLAPNAQTTALQARLREHEEPFALAYLQQFAHRWRAYCMKCFPRVPSGTIKMIHGAYRTCHCTRAEALSRVGPQSRTALTCIECFERHIEILPEKFEDEKRCAGRGGGCGEELPIREGSSGAFKAVCNWCNGILDEQRFDEALDAWREGEGFERLSVMKANVEAVRRRGRRAKSGGDPRASLPPVR